MTLKPRKAQPLLITPGKKYTSYPGHSGYPPVLHEYFREPGWSVDVLLEYERFVGTVFDGFCGGGTIPARCWAHGIDADGSDLQSIAGCTVQDFFTSTAMHDNIISNPPYKLGVPAVRHALARSRRKVAFLLRLCFRTSQKRRAFFRSVPLAKILVLERRPSCPPGIYDGTRDDLGCLIQPEEKGGKMDYAWFIFEHGHVGPVIIDGI